MTFSHYERNIETFHIFKQSKDVDCADFPSFLDFLSKYVYKLLALKKELILE